MLLGTHYAMNTPQDVINTWTSVLSAKPEIAERINATYKFVIEGPRGGTWVVRCANPVEVKEGDAEADCTVTVRDDDFVAVANRSLNPQAAFLMGKIRVSGDITQAMKLGQIIAA